MADPEAALLRKLGPAYNAIDVGDFKTCIKLCEKKDVAKQPLARALRSYALERKAFHEVAALLKATGPGTSTAGKANASVAFQAAIDRDARFKEALDAAIDIAKSGPNSGRVINLVMLVLRNAGAFEQLVDLYAGVTKLFPRASDYAESYFFWQARLGIMGDLEKHGMSLSRSLDNQRYLGWSAAILVCNAKRLASETAGLSFAAVEEAKSKATKKLALAEMMLRKLIKSHPVQVKGAEQLAGTDSQSDYDVPDSSAPETSGVFADNLRVLLMRTLVLQQKYSDAACFAKEELAHLQARERLLYEAEARQLSEEHSAAAALFLELLNDCDSEDWRNWCGWLESSLTVAGNEQAALVAVQKQIEKLAVSKRRGPSLAAIHFNLRRMIFQKLGGNTGAEEEERVGNSITTYLSLFDCKACCFGDLRNALLPFVAPSAGDAAAEEFVSFLKSEGPKGAQQPPLTQAVYFPSPHLELSAFREQRARKRARRWPVDEMAALVRPDSPARQTLLAFLEQRLADATSEISNFFNMAPDARGSDSGIKSKGLKMVRTAITSHQVARFLGAWEALDSDATLTLISSIVKMYDETLWLDEGAQGGAREVKVGDDLALLASHALVDLCNRVDGGERSPQGRQYLVAAAATLEMAYGRSPAGFQLGLMLMEVYARLDMITKVCELYTKLDIKHVQIDSLTHLVLGDAAACGMWSEAARCCSNLEFFWKSSRIDNVDYAKRAFKTANLGHGCDFLRLDRLVEHSHQRCVAICEGAVLTSLAENLNDWDALKAGLLVDATPHTQNEYRLRTRLADLDDKLFLPEALASNYDFGARMSWDYPLGLTARKELERLMSSTIGGVVSQHRSGQGNTRYDEAWHSRALKWLRLRRATSSLFRVAFAQKYSDTNEACKDELYRCLEALRLIGEETQVPEIQADFWQGAWLAVEVTFRLLAFGQAKDDITKIQPCIDQMSELSGALDKLSAKLLGKSQVYHIRDVAFMLSHQVLWLVTLLRGWMEIVPRKKNKKKKVNPSPAEKAFEALQMALKSASVACTAALEALSKALGKPEASVNEEHLKSSQSFNFLKEECVHVINAAISENRYKLHGQLANTIESLRTVIKGAKY